MSGTARLMARDGGLHGRVRIVRSGPHGVLVLGQAEEQDAANAVAASALDLLHGSSTDRLNTPGIEPISRRTPSPRR